MAKFNDQAKESGSPAPRLPAWTKGLISGLLFLHVAAIVSTPFAFACNRGASPLAEAFRNLFRPYTEAFYFSHGYAFFAPDPGPNHLVDYQVDFNDGREPVKGRFPDLATERPRLLYHRYFMMSEALNNRFVPPEFAPEPSPPPLTASHAERERFSKVKTDYEADKKRWQQGRQQYEVMRSSIEQHLKLAYGGDRVTLKRIEHVPADPDDVLYEHKSLSAAESYREMPETLPAGGRR